MQQDGGCQVRFRIGNFRCNAEALHGHLNYEPIGEMKMLALFSDAMTLSRGLSESQISRCDVMQQLPAFVSSPSFCVFVFVFVCVYVLGLGGTLVHHSLKGPLCSAAHEAAQAAARTEHQGAPGPKQLPLEAKQLISILELRGVRIRDHLWAREVAVQDLHDHERLGHDLPIDFHCWQEASGNLLEELLRSGWGKQQQAPRIGAQSVADICG